MIVWGGVRLKPPDRSRSYLRRWSRRSGQASNARRELELTSRQEPKNRRTFLCCASPVGLSVRFCFIRSATRCCCSWTLLILNSLMAFLIAVSASAASTYPMVGAGVPLMWTIHHRHARELVGIIDNAPDQQDRHCACDHGL